MIGLLGLVIAILIVPPGLALIYAWVHRDDPATVEEQGDRLLFDCRAAIQAYREFRDKHPEYDSPSMREVARERNDHARG